MNVKQVRANAEKLRELSSRIEQTVALRSQSSLDRMRWDAACAEFHARFDELSFPGGESGWSAFLRHEKHGLESALLFLEVDQDTFRSGYQKQIVWARLKLFHLSSNDRRRLEEIALTYLHKRVRRHFWDMLAFMRRQGTDRFWEEVRLLAESADEIIARKSHWLLLGRNNAPVRQWIALELSRSKYEKGYIPRSILICPGS